MSWRRGRVCCVATAVLLAQLLLYCSTVSVTVADPGSGCGIPEVPLHARVRHGVLPFYRTGQSLEYVCRAGYEMRGVERVVCVQDDTGVHWSHGPPTCTAVVQCVQPGAPLNGRVETRHGNRVGATALYKCDGGYDLVGTAIQVCQANGEWSHAPAICRRAAAVSALQCGPLSDLKGGRVLVGKSSPGSRALYKCHSGYLLEGETTRTCLMDGRWSGQDPSCTYIVCGELSDPSNGQVRVNDIHLGAQARYRCNHGYQMRGISTRVCQANKQWSGQTPKCIFMQCQPIGSPENGQVLISGREVGSTATYSCLVGFALVGGDSLRTCLDSGQWTGQEPHCTFEASSAAATIECGRIDPPVDGRVVLSGGREPGAVATYSCHVGYVLEGTSIRTCLHSGRWSDREPTCSKSITCDGLMSPYHGRVQWSSLSLNSVATYTCNVGFVLEGARERTCQENGQWSGVPPLCKFATVTCDRLVNPKNGDIIQTGISHHSKATYICDKGFQLKGPKVRVCQSNGQWSEEEPECIAKFQDCSLLPAPGNGSVSVAELAPDSLARYSCNGGFRLVGDSYRVCLRNGNWSGQEPFCAVDCGQLLGLKYGHIQLSDTTDGSAALYSCNEGFYLRGKTKRICLSSGIWSDYEPLCYANSCPGLEAPTNGTVRLKAAVVGGVALYACNAGFTLDGSFYRTCLISGEWSQQTPTCTHYLY